MVKQTRELNTVRYKSGIIFDIQRFSIHDGPGIRTTVFLKGCPLSCLWCQNPESIRKGKDIIFISKRCIDCHRCQEVCTRGAINLESKERVDRSRCDLCGQCTDVCDANALNIVGQEITTALLLEEVVRDLHFYRESGGGVTLSGGEPLAQPDFCLEFLTLLKEKGIDTCVETSGFVSWPNIEAIIPFVDLFLYDLKVIDDRKHQLFTGIANDLILQNAVNLITSGASVEFRMPLVPGHNDDEEDLERVIEFIKDVSQKSPSSRGCRSEPTLHILPYHQLGMSKYEQLGRDYPLISVPTPSAEQIEEIKSRCERMGVIIEVGE